MSIKLTPRYLTISEHKKSPRELYAGLLELGIRVSLNQSHELEREHYEVVPCDCPATESNGVWEWVAQRDFAAIDPFGLDPR